MNGLRDVVDRPFSSPSRAPLEPAPAVRGPRSRWLLAAVLVGAVCAAPLVPSSLVAQANRQGGQGTNARGADTTRGARDTTGGRHDAARESADSLRIAELAQRPPVVTHHTMQLHGKTLRYTATTGMLPIRNDSTGGTEGYIFYVAYTEDGADPATRPLSFVFNGGPGSSTVWLHMGAFGPKRVKLLADGTAPPPPYSIEDNPYTLLDQTDLVFLDPVGTGYSRPAKPKLGEKFWGVNQDIASVGEFIRLYLTQNERWGSPKFLAGESYGTTRASGLSGYLVDRGIALNGVILISAILKFETVSGDLGDIGFLPSYTAIAWYHKKLPADLQSQPLEQVTQQAERWAGAGYRTALWQGNMLSAAERAAAIDTLARFTGLSRAFVDQNNLRIPLGRFDQELLRDQHLTVGRLDGRFTAYATDAGAERGEFDPSEANIRNSFTPVLNDYVRRELHYTDDMVYYILGGGIGRWQPQRPGSPTDVTPLLERAFAKNPHMKLFVAMGYYDTATPYFAVEYTLSHLAVDPKIRGNIITDHFAAGHMVYIDDPSMARFRADLTKFIDQAK
jgi:carboxypeptidase C (cathepsin A)